LAKKKKFWRGGVFCKKKLFGIRTEKKGVFMEKPRGAEREKGKMNFEKALFGLEKETEVASQAC